MNSKLPRLTPLLTILAAVALVAPRHRSGAADEPNGSAATPAADATPGGAAAAIQRQPASRLAPPTVGDELLMRAAARLERRASVSARLRHQVSIGGQPLYGVGSYWQQGTGDELRVRLELQIAGREANLLQASNSRFLWIERRLPTGRTVTRIDLRQLRADPVLGATQLGDIQPGKATWSPMHPELSAHCGGLPSLLAALEENFSFLPPQAMRLAPQSGLESQPASVPVFAIVGHWRQEKLAALLKDGRESRVKRQEPETSNAPSPPSSAIPKRMPQEVLLLVGQADLFPYRIEYRRLETPQVANQDGPSIPYQLSVDPMIVLELTDVAFDVSIAAGQFDYAPGDAEWVDQTATVLERLHRERQDQVAARTGADGTSLPAR
jgi:hypothetical protein